MTQSNPFDMGKRQLSEAIDILKHAVSGDELARLLYIEKLLARPQRIVEVAIPVERDNGEITFYDAYRIQYNNTLGPYKGGIRFHPDVDLDEVMALSFWMTMKNAVVGLPLGGGKGGVVVNPQSLSERELEKLSRGFVQKIAEVIGPDKDIPAPDVNTNSTVMGWMTDEYIQIHKVRAKKGANGKSLTKKRERVLRGTFTGKSLKDGGLDGREEATGSGGVMVLRRVLEKHGKDPKSLTAAVQGYGNVGYFAAKALADLGVRVIGASDSKGAIVVPDGINPDLTRVCKREKGMLAGCYCVGSVCDISKGKQIDADDLLSMDVDIFVPAALEGAITEENAASLNASIVLELANGPTTPGADTILEANGVMVIPDILANSGGVTVSSFEWQKNVTGEDMSRNDVLAKLDAVLTEATDEVWLAAGEFDTSLRKGAFIVALRRLMGYVDFMRD